MPTRFSNAEIDIINNSLKQELEQQKQMEATATQQLSDRVGDIFQKFPMLPADVVLPAAKAGWTDIQLDELAKKVSVQLGTDPDALDPESVKPKSKGFFERNVFDKLKTASRWTTAAWNFPQEMVQGGVAQFFDDQPGVKGWFASTEVGTLIMEDEKAGSGWFVGGEAKVNQGRRARQYRGTAGGQHAYTPGRGAAAMFTPDGSKSFNLVSGFIDAVVALAVPTVPGAKGATGLAKAISEAPTVTKTAKVVANIDEATELQRAVTGLLDATKVADESIESVARFTGGDWHNIGIQDTLRGVDSGLSDSQKSLVNADIKNIDSLFDSAKPISEPFVTYRGIRGGEYLSGLRDTPVGGVWKEKGFVSTTLSKDYALKRAQRGNGLALEIVVPENAKAISPLGLRVSKTGELAQFGSKLGAGEAELILPRNSSFRVIEKSDNLIRVELVGPGIGRPTALQRGAEVVLRAGRAGAVIPPSKLSGEEYTKLAKATAEEMGLTGDTIDVGRFNGFLATDKGKRLVQNLVEANTVDDVYRATSKNLYASTAKALRDAKTQDEVLNVLIDTVGKESGLMRTRLPGTGVTYNTRKHMMDFLNELPVLSSPKAKRLVSNVPRRVADMDAKDPLEQRATIQAIDNWMRQSLVDDATRKETLDRATDAIIGEGATPTAKKQFIEDFEDLMVESWVKAGVAPEIAEALMANHRVIAGRTQLYNLDDAGVFTDSGFYKGLAGGPDKIENGVVVGPQNAAELARNVLEMPDPRQIRRLTSDIGWIFGKSQAGAVQKAGRVMGTDPNIEALREAGQLRLPFAAIESVQQLWRTTTLMTVAYSVRNLIEGQMRLAFNNGQTTSVLRHPLQHLQWATKTKGAGDALGNTWDGIDIGDAAVRTQREYDKAVGLARAAYVNDPISDYRIAERTGDWQRVEKGVNDRKQVVQGHGDQIGKLNADLADRLVAAGATDEEIKLLVGYGGQAAPQELVDKYSKYLKDGETFADWYMEIRDLHLAGRPVYVPGKNGAPGRFADEPVSINLDLPENMNLYLREARERVQRFTGNREDLTDVVASGLLPAERVIGPEIGLSGADVGQVRLIPTPGGRGLRTVRVVAYDEATDEAIVRAFAFREGESSSDLRKLLDSDDVYYDSKLPTVFGWESRQPNYLQEGNLVKQKWDSFVDKWFAFVYTKRSATLERGPAFRQQYFNWVDQLVPSLKQEALDGMVANVKARAASLDITPEQYVGGKKRWQRILDHQQGRKTIYGTLTLKEMDAYAKGNALDDLKQMLYDASERNNLTDIARIVMPFAQAQVDFYKALGRMVSVDTGFGKMPNMYNLRRAQLIVDGGISADPDGDGRGFFYKDPVSGQWSFSYPLGGQLTKMLTKFLGGGPGVTAQMQAPVSGVMLGFDMRPGLGPIGQFAASRILPDSPQYDAIRNWLLPFGETAFKGENVGQQLYKSFVPSWAQKVISGLTDSPEGSSIYANTFMETFQALASSGKYDLATDQGQEDLYEQAKKYAKTLTLMRGFIQFSGPSRFSPEFEVATKQGDVLATLLTKEFFEMQNDTENGGYDTAVQRFIETFGEDAFIYMGRKTRSTVGGLESTEEASKFERQHTSLFRRYKEVAGFFAPGGGSYSQPAYFRQIQTGQKERVTPEELLSQAQRTIGFSYYKAMRDKAGPYPTEAQREYLRGYREFLVKKYPGFGEGETKTSQERTDELNKLREAASTLPDNPVAQAIEKYMAKRDEALTELSKAGLSSLSGKQAEPFRDYLYGYGEALAETYPDFGRVWQQLISYEVDLG